MLTLKIINYATHEVYERTLHFSGQTSSECLIGRTPGCGLLLNSPEVSRVHGRILYRDGQYFFTDLGSTDGSTLNHEMLLPGQDVHLKTDDLIRICEFMIVVESIQAETAIAKNQSSDTLWNPTQVLEVRCVQIIDETTDVKTFRLASDSGQKFDYLPGQFVTLQLEIENQKVLRSYSISSTPSRPELLEITVKRVPAANPDLPPGLVSNWLHDHLKVGDSLQIKGPLGQFSCGKEPSSKLLLISAGSGITPMMSMTRWLCDTASSADIVFAYSARTPGDIVFARELQWLDAQHPSLRVAITTTRTQPDLPWFGYQGRIDSAMIAAMATDFGDRQVFVCGPNPFMAAIKSALETLKFPMEQYHEESFGVPMSKVSADTPFVPKADTKEHWKNQENGKPPLSVTFAQSNQTVVATGEDSILDLAEAAGVDIPSACRMGACGVCKQKLSSGKVKYVGEPSALTEQEREIEQYILPCIARPAEKVVISV